MISNIPNPKTIERQKVNSSDRYRPTPPSKQRIADYWAETERPWGKPVDHDDPACFACGFFNSIDSKSTRWKEWNKTKGLEKAHIIPWALKNGNEVHDYVLLCTQCHLRAPNLGTADLMFEWMRSCPSSFFNHHWSVLPEWNSLSQDVIDNNSAIAVERFQKLCAHKVSQVLCLAEDSLGGITHHYGQSGLSFATVSALMKKALNIIENDDQQIEEIENGECLDCLNVQHDDSAQRIAEKILKTIERQS